jgi:hypothetical protein
MGQAPDGRGNIGGERFERLGGQECIVWSVFFTNAIAVI